MKYLLSLLIIVASATAFANDDKRTIESARWQETETVIHFYSRYSFYSCRFAENLTESILENLGATEIDVRCTGGLENRTDFVNIRANFDTVVIENNPRFATIQAAYNNLEMSFRDSCDLTQKIMRKLMAQFNITDMNQTGRCSDSRGRLNYKLQLLQKI